MITKRPILFVYNYGTGGVLIYFSARSVEEVLSRYPMLHVVTDGPSLYSDEILRRVSRYDIDDDPASHPSLVALAEEAAQKRDPPKRV